MNKRFIGRFIFAGEWLLFCMIYWFGAHGQRTLNTMGHQNNLLQQKIAHLSREIGRKREEQLTMAQSALYKERVARENLHMAYPDEIVYYSS